MRATPDDVRDAPTTYDRFADFYLSSSAHARFEPQLRCGGSFDVSMIDVEQTAIDVVDAPVPEIVFIGAWTNDIDVSVDLGEGWRHNRAVSANALTAIPPSTEARFRVSDAHRITTLAIPEPVLRRLLDDVGLDAGAFSRFYGALHHRPDATRLLGEIWRASERCGPAANLWLDGLTMRFMSLVADVPALSPVGDAPREAVRVRRVLEYIDAHLEEPLTVAELAGVAALGPSRFSRTFKATLGVTVWHHVQLRRCERAQALLRMTGLPVAEIARRSGFAHRSHLARSLRRYCGRAPGELRRATSSG